MRAARPSGRFVRNVAQQVVDVSRPSKICRTSFNHVLICTRCAARARAKGFALHAGQSENYDC